MSEFKNRKAALIGGGGVRTPLVIFGINESSKRLGIDELVLYDVDPQRVRVMAGLGEALVAAEGGSLRIRIAGTVEDTVDGADFVLTSIRAGGIKGRAIDEKIAIRNGFPGQETTGPAGIAMGLKTAVAAIAYAREGRAPQPQRLADQLHQPRRPHYPGDQPSHRRQGHRHLRHAHGDVSSHGRRSEGRAQGCALRVCGLESPWLGTPRSASRRGCHRARAGRR